VIKKKRKKQKAAAQSLISQIIVKDPASKNKMMVLRLLALLFLSATLTTAYHLPYTRKTTWQRSSASRDDNKADKPKVVTCETEGSCRVIRGALKAELNEQRMAKRQQGIGEDNYLEMLGGAKPPSNAPEGGSKKYGLSKPLRPQP
jgi:hypothetical protein